MSGIEAHQPALALEASCEPVRRFVPRIDGGAGVFPYDHRQPRPSRSSGTRNGGSPGAVNIKAPSATAGRISAMRGSSRCVRNRPAGVTTIHSRSREMPAGVNWAAPDPRPAADFSG